MTRAAAGEKVSSSVVMQEAAAIMPDTGRYEAPDQCEPQLPQARLTQARLTRTLGDL
jgi:hypothetical protein